jgi:hypothetical protein
LVRIDCPIVQQLYSCSEEKLSLVSNEISELAKKIFRITPSIVHLGLIDLEGHVLIDQSAASSQPFEPDTDRVIFYYQVALRRSRREHFNDVYGQTTYVHIHREKIQQLILYLPMLTIYITIDKDVLPDEIVKIVEKIKSIDKEILNKAIISTLYLSK